MFMNIIIMPDPDAKRLMWFLFAGSRGGENRIKIIGFLKKRLYSAIGCWINITTKHNFCVCACVQFIQKTL